MEARSRRGREGLTAKMGPDGCRNANMYACLLLQTRPVPSCPTVFLTGSYLCKDRAADDFPLPSPVVSSYEDTMTKDDDVIDK